MNLIDRITLNRVQNMAEAANPPTRKGASMAEINAVIDALKGKTFGGGDNLSEVVYLTCLKTLYETVGKLNIDVQQDTNQGTKRIYDHEAVRVLHYRPNPHLTPSTFKQLMEFNRNHYGNAYAFIHRDQRSGKLISLIPLHPRKVTVLVDNKQQLGLKSSIMYKYQPDRGESVLINEKDMLHLKFSLTSADGLVGKSVQEVLATTMEGAKASQAFLNNLYQNGMTAAAALEYVGDLDDARVAKLLQKIERFAMGEDNAGRIVPIPPGTKLVPLDMKLTESQFFELKKYSALQIASVFGVKPTQINDYEKASYANSEAQNLSFYVDTLLAILKQYEEEMDYKLLSEADMEKGFHFKINVNSMLRADLKSQADIMCAYVNNGILKPNEARGKLDMTADADGDRLMANGNFIPLSMIGEQYGKEREDETV